VSELLPVQLRQQEARAHRIAYAELSLTLVQRAEIDPTRSLDVELLEALEHRHAGVVFEHALVGLDRGAEILELIRTQVGLAQEQLGALERFDGELGLLAQDREQGAMIIALRV